MGILSWLFQPQVPESVENRLIREYGSLLHAMGASRTEAHSGAVDFVKKVKSELASRGLSAEETGTGDKLLLKAKNDAQTHSVIESLKSEGVRDADIRDWWNLSALERAVLEKADEISRTQLFLECLRKGLSDSAAANVLWKNHPKYGNPAEGEGDDRPIPIELKNRVMLYRERHYANPQALKTKTEQSSSFNALIRQEIRNGAF